MPSRPREPPKLAPRDKLIREIQKVLTPDLIIEQHRGGRRRYDGYCYVASEAYFYLAGGRDAGLRPMQRTDQSGSSHWWLVDDKERVIDLTLGAGEKPGRFPYREDTRRTFRKIKGGPSARARTIIRRVEAARGNASE